MRIAILFTGIVNFIHQIVLAGDISSPVVKAQIIYYESLGYLCRPVRLRACH